jgi:hypothetical protein
MRLGLAAILLAVASLAPSSSAAAEAPPSMDGLPSATLPAPPERRSAPKAIARNATVDGILVVRDPEQPRLGVVVTPGPSAQGGACLSSPGAQAGSTGDVSVVSEAGVRFVAVRSQKFILDESGAKLVVLDAWVDAATLGAREAARYEVPLGRLTAGPGSIAVYGFRDGGLLRAIVPIEGGGFVHATGTEPHSVTCAHASLTLDTTAAGGQVAVVLGQVEVPATPLAREKTKRRPVQISLSTSRTDADAAPVLSATVAWADAIHVDVPAFAPMLEDRSRE